MKVVVTIRRYDPARDREPYDQSYTLEAQPTDRVLDLLHHIKWHHDGTLAFRRSCGHGICGSDTMLINGRNRLACKVLVRDLGSTVRVEPMRGYPVIKDLVVDLKGFFRAYRAVKPYLINEEPPPPRERLQTPAERERYDDTTKCILCAACTTSCPQFWADEVYLGPAAIVNAHRFIFDSRDRGAQERLRVLNHRAGVWRCRTIFNCTEACPRDIQVTRAIQEVKRALLTQNL